MNKTRKKRWLRDLRSGKFNQTTETLMNDDGYCCLGVLACKTKGITPAYATAKSLTGIDRLDLLGPVTKAQRDQYSGLTGDDEVILEHIEVELVDMNDQYKKSFKQIAQWIERNL